MNIFICIEFFDLFASFTLFSLGYCAAPPPPFFPRVTQVCFLLYRFALIGQNIPKNESHEVIFSRRIVFDVQVFKKNIRESFFVKSGFESSGRGHQPSKARLMMHRKTRPSIEMSKFFAVVDYSNL